MFAMLAAAGISLTGTSAGAQQCDRNYHFCWSTTGSAYSGCYPNSVQCASPGSRSGSGSGSGSGYTNADSDAFKAFKTGFCRTAPKNHPLCK
jgi:hypothetical protein